jgi:predicted dehydrogenase
VITRYLAAEPPERFGIEGARVTHIWCDDPAAARHVARASLIPTVVDRPEDLLGEVDAVLIPTDIGAEHLDRARPFVDAGIPVFIDKPLTDREDDLRQFIRWQREGRAILSSSALRYGREFAECRGQLGEVGDLRLITMTTCRSWERYGIHAAEGVYPFLAPGRWETVANTGTARANIAHARHADGVDVVLAAIDDLDGAFGCLSLYGTRGAAASRFSDSFSAFKAQLEAFVRYLRTGERPFPFDETAELVRIVIAGIRSRAEGGRPVRLSEIAPEEGANA